jgi:Asp-tRNA(Asn)/Glu-tRNA(Gln) amidotransferase A subunit family amidase
MLVAPHFREDALIQAAAAYQRAVDWPALTGAPGVPRL